MLGSQRRDYQGVGYGSFRVSAPNRVITGRATSAFPISGGTINFLAVASSTTYYSTNMDRFASSSSDRADASGNPRFTSQAATAEDLLKAQTVGLVNLDDYRKRRADALDRKERGDTAISSGENTPTDG